MQYPYQVCREWEATALRVNKDVRVALIRIGVVLGKDGGALGMILASDSFYLYGCYFDKIVIINLGNPCGKIYSGLCLL